MTELLTMAWESGGAFWSRTFARFHGHACLHVDVRVTHGRVRPGVRVRAAAAPGVPVRVRVRGVCVHVHCGPRAGDRESLLWVPNSCRNLASCGGLLQL